MKNCENLWLAFFVIVILALVAYPILTPNDVLVKQDKDYLYYKEYSWYGQRSKIYKYHKTMYHKGKVVYKYVRTYLYGAPGKGGRWQTETKITVNADGKSFEKVYVNIGIFSTVEIEKGDNATVVETFYPRYEVEIVKGK